MNGASRQNTVFEYIQEVQVKTDRHSGRVRRRARRRHQRGHQVRRQHLHRRGALLPRRQPAQRRPREAPRAEPGRRHDRQLLPGRQAADVRHEFGGSIGGPIVSDKLFFFGSFSPRVNVRDNDLPVLERHRARRHRAHDASSCRLSARSASAAVASTRMCRRSSRRPTSRARCRRTTASVRTSLSSSKSAQEPNNERGWEQMQANVNGNVDFVISNGAYATFRARLLLRPVQRHRHSADDELSILNGHLELRADARSRRTWRDPTGTLNTPRAQITDFDTTKRTLFNADYNHTVPGRRLAHAEGRRSESSTRQRRGLGAIPAVRRRVLGQHVGARRPGERQRRVWLLRGQRPRHLRQGGREHHLALRPGPVADRRPPHLEHRPPHRERKCSCVPDRSVQDNAFEFGFEEKLAPRLGVQLRRDGHGRAKLYASYGRYYDWTKYELPRGSFGGDIWCIKYRAIDNPTIRSTANYRQHAGSRPLAAATATAATVACRASRRSIADIEADVAGQLSAPGFDFEVNPRTVATVHFVHNNLNRTIEDLGALVDGNEVYLLGNPGEGTTAIMPASRLRSPAAARSPMPKAKRQYDARRARRQPPVREQLVRQRQPNAQPAVWQLRRSRELGRNPHADDGRQLVDVRSSRRARSSARAATPTARGTSTS